MLQSFPKTAALRDGTTAMFRLLEAGDTDKLHEMFKRLKPESRTFLYDDVTDYKVVKNWTGRINHDFILPLVAVSNGDIIADGTLHRRDFGPLRHVGRVRVVVRDDYLGKGVGTILLKELVALAKEGKLKLLSCMLVEKQEASAIEAMEALGFKRTACIPGYAIDPAGKTHDMVLLLKNLEEDDIRQQ